MEYRKSGVWLMVAVGIIAALVTSRRGMVGRPAPDYSLVGAYGGRFHPETFKGKPVLLMFWTTSCGICRHELPILDRLAMEFRQSGTQVVAVNIGDLQGARDYMREQGLRLTNTIDEDGEMARRYKVSGVPKLVLIDGSGKVVHEATGAAPESTLRHWLRAE